MNVPSPDENDPAIAAIDAYLASRGEKVGGVRRLIFSWKLVLHMGVSNIARAYQVIGIEPDGSLRKHLFAFDPAGWTTFERSGLKRYYNGRWFDASIS